MSTTSTPREVTPAANAADSSGELGRMSWPMTMPGLPSGRRPPRRRRRRWPRRPRRELLGHEAADVVGLDEVCKGGHGRHPSRPTGRRSRSLAGAGQESAQDAQVSRARPASTAPESASALAWPRAGPPSGRAAPASAAPRPQRRRCAAAGRGAGTARLAHGVGEREQVVGREGRLGVLAADADDLPAARGGHPLGVLAAQVVGVRLGVRRERAEHDRPVGVGIGQRRDGGALAPRLGAPTCQTHAGDSSRARRPSRAPRRRAATGAAAPPAAAAAARHRVSADRDARCDPVVGTRRPATTPAVVAGPPRPRPPRPAGLAPGADDDQPARRVRRLRPRRGGPARGHVRHAPSRPWSSPSRTCPGVRHRGTTVRCRSDGSTPRPASRPARIVVYRRPVETRVSDRRDVAALVADIVTEQVAGPARRLPRGARPGLRGVAALSCRPGGRARRARSPARR